MDKATRCKECPGCRHAAAVREGSSVGCGKCLQCYKKRYGTAAESRQSCALSYCTGMRQGERGAAIAGLGAGWTLYEIKRKGDGPPDTYWLSPEGARFRSRTELLVYLHTTGQAADGWDWDRPARTPVPPGKAGTPSPEMLAAAKRAGKAFYDYEDLRALGSNGLHEEGFFNLNRDWTNNLLITDRGVVHGHGMVAKMRLAKGKTFVDVTSPYVESAPPLADQDDGPRSERYIITSKGRTYFKLGNFSHETGDDVWAHSFFVNEAMEEFGQVANAKRTIERNLPGSCLGLKLLRDVDANEELLVEYVDKGPGGSPRKRRRRAPSAAAADDEEKQGEEDSADGDGEPASRHRIVIVIDSSDDEGDGGAAAPAVVDLTGADSDDGGRSETGGGRASDPSRRGEGGARRSAPAPAAPPRRPPCRRRASPPGFAPSSGPRPRRRPRGAASAVAGAASASAAGRRAAAPPAAPAEVATPTPPAASAALAAPAPPPPAPAPRLPRRGSSGAASAAPRRPRLPRRRPRPRPRPPRPRLRGAARARAPAAAPAARAAVAPAPRPPRRAPRRRRARAPAVAPPAPGGDLRALLTGDVSGFKPTGQGMIELVDAVCRRASTLAELVAFSEAAVEAPA
ncbi:hypothetical protein JL722_3230 [Aureococcus anophagefferens]|nr:hypothetical protein JL722_3230 [Aureococcus anophagefferens]